MMFEKKDDGEWGYSRRFWVQVIVLALLICAIGFSTQRTAARTEKLSQETTALAAETQKCFNELATILKERARLTTENDDRSQEQRKAIADLLRDALNPPPNLVGLPPTDPRIQQYNTALTVKYYNIIAASQQRQNQIDLDKQAHPIPDPTCGQDTPIPGQ